MRPKAGTKIQKFKSLRILKELKKLKRKQQKLKQKEPETQKIPTLKDKYFSAIGKLQECVIPDKIPCREKEKELIYNFLRKGIKNKGCTSDSLCISGVPGIGKTISFGEVLRRMLQEDNQISENESENLVFIHINGMNLSSPENVYLVILKQLTGIDTVSKSQACLILDHIFRKGSLPKKFLPHRTKKINKIKIVLLDELDYLITKNQELLYNLFDWPHCKMSKLLIVGISNTMDFQEKLNAKILSRLSKERVLFKLYSTVQIEQIIKSRLQGQQDIFEEQAIQFLCKKIAMFSSDIRRTLHLSRKAVELALQTFEMSPQEELKKVTISHIREAHNILYSSPKIICIQQLSHFHKILMISLALEIKNRGEDYGFLSEIHERGKLMSSNLGWKAFLHNAQETKVYFQSLENINIVTCKDINLIKRSEKKSGKNEENVNPNSKKLFNMPETQIWFTIQLDDLTNALKDDEIFLKFYQLF